MSEHVKPSRGKKKPSPLITNSSVASDAPTTPDPLAQSPSKPDPTDPTNPPLTPDALHAWIASTLDYQIARTPLIPEHAAPFDYLCHAFFEGTQPARPGCATTPDSIVWANRGGGKTFLGTLATLLDLLFKPGCQVRILAGSVEQGRRMHEHLRSFLDHANLEHVKRRITARRIALVGRRSAVEILAASQTSVRGTRVQKLRCDEVDLFDPDVWTAAQLVTRSIPCPPSPWGTTIRGCVEALSTMHRPFGPMWKLVGDPNVLSSASAAGGSSARPTPAPRSPRTLFRWGLLDILEHCTEEHSCDTCPLYDECQGRAKLTPPNSAGHMSVADAVSMKLRVGRETWDSEMLCLRPSRSSTVYPEFDPRVHLWHAPAGPCTIGPSSSPRFAFCIAGMDFGYRSESVLLLAGVTKAGEVYVLREHCRKEVIVAEHVRMLNQWRDEGLFRMSTEPGPAPILRFIGIDPAGNACHDKDGESSVQPFRNAKYIIRFRSSAITLGIRIVRGRLAPAWGGPGTSDLSTEPKLFIHADCTRLIECLTRYHYPEHKPESLEPDKDGHDHACDALRYMLLNLDEPHKAQASNYAA